MVKKTKLQVFIENSVSSLLSIIKIILLSKITPSRIRKDSSKCDCVILGNGPSLNNFLIKGRNFLSYKDILCVNFFPVTDYYTEVQPSYLVINAPEMWLEDVDQHYIEIREALFKAVAMKTKWLLTLFMPIAAKKYPFWQNILRDNPNVQIYYYNTTPIEGFRSFTFFCFKYQLGMPRPHNVLIPSILLALQVGYQKIYLAGADHSWLRDLWVTEDNQVLLTQKHFYDEKTAQAQPMKKLGRDQRKLHEVLIKFVHSFQGYFIINDYAVSRNAEILNITPGSYIDAFKRIKLPES